MGLEYLMMKTAISDTVYMNPGGMIQLLALVRACFESLDSWRTVSFAYVIELFVL